MLILNNIYIYPIKSLAGIQLQSWPVQHNGLLYDRKWMLVDENLQFLSQRRLPKMALIKPRIADERLILTAPGQPEIDLPLHPNAGDDISVTIWHDQCLAKTTDAAIDQWFSNFLGIACRLVYHPDERIRQVDQRYADSDDQTAFADGFPFLIVSEASLQALNREMTLDMSMARFRPNLVIGGCEAFAEDYWRQISINGIGFRLPKPCSRCSVPGIDPETAEISKQPLAVLNRLRKWQNKVYFGQNALHDACGSLSVSDEVQIIASGDNQPPISLAHSLA